MKTCNKCNLTKQISEFNFRNDTQSHRNNCKSCQYLSQKKWRGNNPNFAIENKGRYHKNKVSILHQKKEYYLNNITNIKEYRNKNKTRAKKVRKIYSSLEVNRVKDRVRQKERKAIKKSTSDKTITVETLDILLKAQNNKCYHCGCSLDKTKHLDHYVPLNKGGTHSITNVVWSCVYCNTSKKDTMPITLMLV